MIFGLPGAALAMYRCAKPEKKKAAGGLLLSAALACMFTGITEPIEFSFLFVAPMLFAVQVILAGSAYMVAHILNIAVGLTFSGGLLDLVIFGVLQGNAKTSWLRIIPAGIVYFLLYYVLFSFLSKKFDLKTPGREDDDEETKLYTKADVNARRTEAKEGESGRQAENSKDSRSAAIAMGMGGRNNITSVDCCATRLRCSIADSSLVLWAMSVIFVICVGVVMWAEVQGNPHLLALGADSSINMEGKESRFGVLVSSLFAVVTTAASCGAVIAMHDSFTALGGMVPMWLMQIGEVVFGGVGSGLYGMMLFVLLAVFIAGLMIGRTPEYLGKKIDVREMKLTALAILVTPTLVLMGAALAMMTDAGRSAMLNPGPHGFSEVEIRLQYAVRRR